jgi:hypothetical protein
MDSLSRDQILKAMDLKVEKVDVPEWGGAIYLKVMSVGERDSYENEWVKSKLTGMENFRTRFLVRTICDGQGNRLFENKDIPNLMEKSAAVMGRLWDESMSLNKLKNEDVEELAKN